MRRVLPALLLIGCLHDPVGLAPGDGGADASAATDLGAGSSFPPPGAMLALRPGAVADVNGDGRDDLILCNTAAGSFGLYILLGRSSGIGEVYDDFLSTGSVMPLGVTAAQIGGGAALDLVVLGRDGGAGIVLALDGLGGGRFAAPAATPLPFVPDATSAKLFVASGRFAPGGLPGLLVGDHGNAYTGVPSSWPDLSQTHWFRLDTAGECGGADLVGAVLYPSAHLGLDDLWLMRFDCISHFANDGTGGFNNGTQKINWSQTDARFFGGQPGDLDCFDVADFDGDGVSDVIGGFEWITGFTGASLLGVADAGAMPAELPEPVLLPEREVLGPVTSIVAGRLDDDPRTDVVYLDSANVDAGNLPTAVSYPNVSFGGNLDMGVSSDEPPMTFHFTSLTPQFLVGGNFRGSGRKEVVAVSSDGHALCLQLDGTGLALCH